MKCLDSQMSRNKSHFNQHDSSLGRQVNACHITQKLRNSTIVYHKTKKHSVQNLYDYQFSTALIHHESKILRRLIVLQFELFALEVITMKETLSFNFCFNSRLISSYLSSTRVGSTSARGILSWTVASNRTHCFLSGIIQRPNEANNTHISLLQEVNSNFPTSIPRVFVWELPHQGSKCLKGSDPMME